MTQRTTNDPRTIDPVLDAQRRQESEAQVSTNRALTSTLEQLANKLILRRKCFAESFKNGGDFPKFDGEIWAWPKWKRKFFGFMGENNLTYILDESTDMTDIDNKERNEWLHHAFQKNMDASALNKVKNMPRDEGKPGKPIIPNGRES